MILLLVLYVLCVLAMFHSYMLYPLILAWLAKGKSFTHQMYSRQEELPQVVIFFSVFNGELVLAEKIESMLASDYPADKLRIIVGSDASADRTDEIVLTAAAKDSRVSLQRFSRRGKANVINAIRAQLVQEGIADNTVYVLTDAYAIFEKNTLFEMVKHFKDKSIGIVGANYINTNVQGGGISHQEKAYIQRENLIKYREGVVLGSMMGVYGACYAVRGVEFPEFPSTILMEDFYVSMLALQRRQKGILALDSKFYENIPNSIDIEFKRKKRISAGNFQNLAYFKTLLLPTYGKTAFAFWSHKVLRWLGPFFIFFSYVFAGLLALTSQPIFIALFGLHLIVLSLPIFDRILQLFNIHLAPLRYITYFLSMNMAILAGFKWYWQGIETNVWQPTNRN
jgi:cellulose synthase/poly-beta-1,6-N-acetylglucosamine synthase-like glycosyltransferase